MDSEGRVTELDDDPIIEGSRSHTPREVASESSGLDPERERLQGNRLSADHTQGRRSGTTTPTQK